MVRHPVLGDLPFGAALQAGRIGLWRAVHLTTLARLVREATVATGN